MIRLRRAPRHYEVVIGKPWTINGKPTAESTPLAVLEEIYDAATLFPITITVTGPGTAYRLEMDEEMKTQPLPDPEGPTKPAAPSAQEKNSAPKASTVTAGTAAPVAAASAAESAASPAPAESAASPALEPQVAPDVDDDDEDSDEKTPWVAKLSRKTWALAAGAIAAVVVVGLVLTQLLGSSSDDASASEDVEENWATELPESTDSGEALDEEYTDELWTIEPGEVDSVSWFDAGVVATDEEDQEVRLYSHLSGEEIATYTAGDDVDLGEDLRWATEFLHEGDPAVGLRIGDSFVGLSATGETQEWEIPSSMEISVHGATPVMSNASTEENSRDVTYQALRMGEEDPVDLTTNPDLATRAVDDDWILQLDGSSPRVALNPVDRSNEDTTAHAVTLSAPHPEASFVRHLDAGHGNSLALWRVREALYIGVHPVTGDDAGQAASFVPAPFNEDEASSWDLAAGLDLALLGPYAFSLDTGELAEYSHDGPFERAYGPAAVSVDDEDRRIFTLDQNEYTETNRIIGYTGRGAMLVRLTDGSVAAYGESGGTI